MNFDAPCCRSPSPRLQRQLLGGLLLPHKRREVPRDILQVLERRDHPNMSIWTHDDDRALRWVNAVGFVSTSTTTASHLLVVKQDPGLARQHLRVYLMVLAQCTLTSTSAT